MLSPEILLATGKGHQTPFYLYDMSLLHRTLEAVKESAACNPKFRVNYAMKACNELPILIAVKNAGLGVDTVSGGEIKMALEAGFGADDILFAGVGKTDTEIDLALETGIKIFNVESLPELEVISERAVRVGKSARVALRINPDIDAHTHHYITTGLPDNKFGINIPDIEEAVKKAVDLPGIEFYGLHFHIGSQIIISEPFRILCEKANAITRELTARGIKIKLLDLGGGLGIDYRLPRQNPIADFKSYFDTVNANLDVSDIEEVDFELGRAIVGQTGHLLTRVLYVKKGIERTFAIVDAGMTELIRPALYQARHEVENLSGNGRGDKPMRVDVVGPVCESADVFGEDYLLAAPRRGDIIDIQSAGAYGQVMSSHYNGRRLNPSVFI